MLEDYKTTNVAARHLPFIAVHVDLLAWLVFLSLEDTWALAWLYTLVVVQEVTAWTDASWDIFLSTWVVRDKAKTGAGWLAAGALLGVDESRWTFWGCCENYKNKLSGAFQTVFRFQRKE